MDRSTRHNPNRLSSYIEIHETVLGQLESQGLVEEDTLEFISAGNGLFILRGELLLRGKALRLQVEKVLEDVDPQGDEPRVQTIEYSYNVSLRGRGNIFRYDSPHADEEDGINHHLHHHKHTFDPFSATPNVGTVTILQGGDWPLLSEVIREADDWYSDNYSLLAIC